MKLFDVRKWNMPVEEQIMYAYILVAFVLISIIRGVTSMIELCMTSH